MQKTSASKTSFELSRAYPIGCTLNTVYSVTGIICSTGRYNLYRARDRRTGRTVTIKELTRAKITKESQAELFQSEIRALNRARHPNLPLMLDHFSDRGNLYIVFEHVTGMCLGEMLSAEGPLPAELVYPIFMEIAQALSATHEAGVIHNEITPSSIFLLGDTDSAHLAKLTDFGGASIKDDAVPTAGRKPFRPEYASPEALRGERTCEASDIYSIGVVLYTALTGRLPFSCEDVNELIINQMNSLPRRFREAAPELEIPFHVEATVFKCLAKAKEDRFQSAQDLAKWLKSWRHASQTVEMEPIREVPTVAKSYTLDELNNIGVTNAAPAIKPPPTTNSNHDQSTIVPPRPIALTDTKEKAQARESMKKQARAQARAEAKARAEEQKRYDAEVREMEREAEKLQKGPWKKFEIPLYLTAAVMAGIMGFVVTVNVRHSMNAGDAQREALDINAPAAISPRQLIAAREDVARTDNDGISVDDTTAQSQTSSFDQSVATDSQAAEQSPTNALQAEQPTMDTTASQARDYRSAGSSLTGNDPNAVNQEAAEVPVTPGEPVQFEGEPSVQPRKTQPQPQPKSEPREAPARKNQSDFSSYKSEPSYSGGDSYQPARRRAYQTSFIQ